MKELPKTAVGDRGSVELVEDSVLFSRYGRVVSRCVIYPDGSRHEFDVWSKNWRSNQEFAIVVPYYSASRTFTLLYEYYPAAHSFHLGLPGGNVDSNRHTSILQAAKEELYEEAHLKNGTWYPLLPQSSSGGSSQPGLLNDKYQQDWSFPFLCVDPEQQNSSEFGTDHATFEAEELIEVRMHVPFEKVRSDLLAGRFQANQTSTLFFAFEKLKELGLA
ncbi:hypothetical protein FVE85_3203 [Porphyridium purpureum]|uniref:Nudix hydrolase domain-containing protein n=1 Tax=Porphyridium purpureum TaxID=35688 RepID=A0A5J4YVS9_PORPP|nr:hypothetical protein FVE85_3203 [Porphyridium purpureum]|eukprot:POR6055..scf227_4